MFDSDSESSNITQNDTSDGQILAEVRQDQLQEDNASLVKEINVLRAQFEQAVAISRRSDEYAKEIDSLKQQLCESNAQRDDISRRLEISIRARDEIARRHEEEQAKNSAQRASDVRQMQKELSKAKKNFQTQMDHLYTENKRLQTEKDADDVAQKTLVGKIDKLVSNSSHFFGKTVNSFDELCSIMESVPQQPEVQQIERPVQPKITKESNDQKLKETAKKLKRQKQQLRSAVAQINELRNTVAAKEAENEHLRVCNQNTIETMEEQMKEIRERSESNDRENSEKIEKLNEKIKTMKAEATRRAKQQKTEVAEKVKAKAEKTIVPVQVSTPVVANNEDKLINEQLNARIDELTTQLTNACNERDEVRKSLLEAEKAINDMKIAHESEHNELAALRTVHKETVCEIETIRAALHARQETRTKKEISHEKKEQKRLCAKILQLENTNEELKKSIFDVQLENEKASQTIKEQTKDLEKVCAANDELKSRISSLNNEICDMKREQESIVIPTEEDFFPASMWTMCDFDSTLMQCITKVATNTALSAPSKLQHIYKAIQKFYSKQTAEIREMAEEANNDSQKMYSYMNDFIVSLSIAMNDQAESFEKFMQNANVSAELVSRAAELRAASVDASRARDALQQGVNAIVDVLGIDRDTDINDLYNFVREKVEKIEMNCEKAKSKAKKMKKDMNAMQNSYETEVIPTKAENERLKTTLESANATIANLSAANKKLKTELSAVKRENSELEAKIEAIEEKNSEEMEEFKEAKEEEIEEINEKHENKLYEMTNELENLKSNLSNSEEQAARYRKVIEAQKVTVTEKESLLKQTIEQGKANEESIKKNFAIEKEKLVESYEKAVAEVTEQCEKHRCDIVKLSEELSQMDKKYKDTKMIVVQMKRDTMKLEKEKKMKEEEYQREEKILQSKVNSAIIKAESQCNTKLNEQKTKYESEKRKILSYVADEFRQFFNASESIDDRSFRTIISKVKEEVERLQKVDSTIRRMVGATGRQTTDDAVAQLFLNEN